MLLSSHSQTPQPPHTHTHCLCGWGQGTVEKGAGPACGSAPPQQDAEAVCFQQHTPTVTYWLSRSSSSEKSLPPAEVIADSQTNQMVQAGPDQFYLDSPSSCQRRSGRQSYSRCRTPAGSRQVSSRQARGGGCGQGLGPI